MRIKTIKIQNFRSIKNLEMELGDITVFIGQNNTGKTAVLDAVRIILTRRWGQRGTGFTENDIYRSDENADPKSLPPVIIQIGFEESAVGAWDADMVAVLDDIITFLPDGRNALVVRVTCAWSAEKETFDPNWEFLDTAGLPLTGKAQRATNLTGFFGYVPVHWLGALRDAANEFTPRSGHWGRLLKSVSIPKTLEEDALRILAELDARIVAADPKLAEIAGLIGQATGVAIGESPGSARVNTLPLAMEEMLQRTGIVLRNESLRPWLPLSQHGQGLQSLAVIFLFQAAVLQQLAEADRTGVEAIFGIEEPEAHLHPQAARTLWEKIKLLPGQLLMTTHSPYFVQQVPLRDLRLMRLIGGCTEYSSIPATVTSGLPWTQATENQLRSPTFAKIFLKSPSGNVAARCWFNEEMEDALRKCFKDDADAVEKTGLVATFRHSCRVLPSAEDENDLAFHGRRVRGEIFFARRWILVEGVCEYLLLRSLGRAFGWDLDAHGVSVVDFQQSGSPGIYAGLAAGLQIPWTMIVDGDAAGEKFRDQVRRRGFQDAEIATHVTTLPPPNTLELQLIADGHEALLRQILLEAGVRQAGTFTVAELTASLNKHKTDYMAPLARKVENDSALANRMPRAYVDVITGLRDGTL